MVSALWSLSQQQELRRVVPPAESEAFAYRLTSTFWIRIYKHVEKGGVMKGSSLTAQSKPLLRHCSSSAASTPGPHRPRLNLGIRKSRR